MADPSPTPACLFAHVHYDTVPVGALAKHPLNTRLPASAEDKAFLALRADLAANGLIEPLVVILDGNEAGHDTRYLVVDGSRRCQALQALLGAEQHVRVQIVELSEAQIVEVIASTDVGSAKLTDYERALLMKEECRIAGSADALAARYGISKSAISKHMALANLSADVLACVTDRARISLRAASAYRVAMNRDPVAVDAALAPFRERPKSAREVFAAVQAVVAAGDTPQLNATPTLAYGPAAAELLDLLGRTRRITPRHHEALLGLLDAIASNTAFALPPRLPLPQPEVATH